jgi:hypothetical protein
MLNIAEFEFGPDFRLVLQSEYPIESLSYLNHVEKKIIANDDTFSLGYEVIDSVLSDVQSACINLLNGDVLIHDFFNKTEIGVYYNVYRFNLFNENSFATELPHMEENISLKYHMTSGNDYTVCYYIQNQVPRIDLVPVYPEDNSDTIAFEKWLSNYKTIVSSVISLDKCAHINERINSIYKELLGQ